MERRDSSATLGMTWVTVNDMGEGGGMTGGYGGDDGGLGNMAGEGLCYAVVAISVLEAMA